jgi:hypothetical protein
MHPGLATRQRRATALVLVACSAACATPLVRYQPGPLSADQLELVRKAEASYRKDAPDYPVLRARVLEDPLATAWLVRMFVRDLVRVRERPLAPTGGEEIVVRAVEGADPVGVRATNEIRHIGVKAVPLLIGDLLLHEATLPRELGIDLLAVVGPAAVPDLLDVAARGDVRQRRAAARALGRVGASEQALPVLVAMAEDGDYTVRADALRGLAGCGEPAIVHLAARLSGDQDPFVQRVAAEQLGRFPVRASGDALVAYLERCLRARDESGERSAQAALQVLAGKRGLRTPEAWQRLVMTMPERLPASAAPKSENQDV